MHAATEAGGAASAKNVYYEGGANTAVKHVEQIFFKIFRRRVA